MLLAFSILLGIILLWAVGLAMLLGSSSLEQLKSHWGEERCTMAGLVFASMVKPDDDPRSGTDFASENFKFCMGEKVNTYLMSLFGPMATIFDKQMGAANTLGDIMNSFRKTLTRMKDQFESMVGRFFDKFKRIGFMTSRIFQHLFMAMKKAAGIALASLFAGLAIQTTMYNYIDFVLKVIIIILWVMTALAIIFFLPILPVMFLVFMAVNGIESALPGKTGALGSIFCFAPDVLVTHESGIGIPIELLKVGNRLAGGAEVEAVIELQGSTAPLYSIRGVKVSGDHRIWSEAHRQWILVKEHPESVKLYTAPERLWTLITSNRQIPVKASSGAQLLFADWEELPDTAEGAEVWETLVREILPTSSNHVPHDAPVLDSKCKVKKFQGGWVPLDEIKIGDWILGDKRWTHVLGVCRRKVEGGIGSAGGRFTDGVWFKESSGRWTHSRRPSDTAPWIGITLLTDSGDFRVLFAKGTELVVRDFTEVGWEKLDATYARVEGTMAPPCLLKKETRPLEASE